MALMRAAALLVLSVLHVCSPAPARRPVGWFQHCRSSTNLSVTALEVLPGGGWDNLRNIEMGRVMDFSYSQCQTTEDGVYFVPDDVFVIPRKATNLETYAEVITKWQDYRSSTSASINYDQSSLWGSLSGTFSAEHQRVKTKHVNDKSATTIVQIRNHIYTVKVYPDFTLDSHFVQQVEDIAGAITNNQTKLATYLSEKLVADYGTHVITSIDAGANLVKEDYVKSEYVSSSSSSLTSIKASAGYNFFSLFSNDVHVSYNHASSDQTKYDSSITSSFMEGHGGAPFYPGMRLSKWQESTRNNLVAIDRSGLPLYYVINSNTLPDLPEPTVRKVADSLKQAIVRYYKVNRYIGCVNYDSPNFNIQANIDDNSCETATNYSLGGVSRECDGPICGDIDYCHDEDYYKDCRSPYQKQEVLFNHVYTAPFGGFCGVSTYWCYSTGPTENKGFLFGGIYSNSLNNPITKGRSCPEYFTPIKIYLYKDIMIICLSQDYERAATLSLPFGGFFSAYSTNPWTNGSHCPPQYKKNIAMVGSITIYYCIKSSSFRVNQLLPIRLPPFTTRPPGV